jgi:predicted ATP-grasp superfamily ATP-dependent carboligase
MNTTQSINRPVAVTAMSFGRDMRAYPRRMEYQGVTYDFIDAGLRLVVKSGERIAEILTMSDGASEFHLKSDNRGGSWTLLSMS